MSSGFQSWTNNGSTIQIDTSYPVLSFRTKGTATPTFVHPSSNASFNNRAYYTDISVSNTENPMIAIHGPSSYGVIAGRQTGSNWTFRIIAIVNSTVGTAPFTWYHFDSPVSRSSGAGMEVFNPATGKCTYSSYHQPIDVRSFQGTGLNDGAYEISLPSHRKYASIFSAKITLYENTEMYTNQDIFTYWTYDLNCAYAEVNPSPYDGSVKRCGFSPVTINAGVDQGTGSPAYPTGDLGSFGASASCLIVDVTDL